MKIKSSENRHAIIVLLIFTITLVVSMFMGGLYDNSNAATTSSNDFGNYPENSLNEAIVKEALDEYADSKYFDCSGFVNNVLNTAFGTDFDYSAADWYAQCGNQSITLANGKTYTAQIIAEKSDAAYGTAWYDAIDVSKLESGDIICGKGHALIYLGNGTTANLKSYVKGITGITPGEGNYANSSSYTSNPFTDSYPSESNKYWYVQGNLKR